jgi:hypothetical protein
LIVDDLPLLPGQYSLDVALMDGNNMHAYDYWKGVAPFSIRNEALKEVGVARIKRRWERP